MVTITENKTFAASVSKIRPPDCSKLDKNAKNGDDVTIFDMTSLSIFFLRCFLFLVKFTYWFKFHVNIITGSRIMTIFFYKGLTRHPEIGITPVWVLPNIWRLGRVMNTKFETNVSNAMLLNTANFQGFQFLPFLPTGGGGGKIPPDPSRLGLRKKLFLKQVKSRVSRSKYPRIMIYFADFNININAYLSWFCYCMQHSNCYWNIDHSITSLNTGAI